MESEQFEKMINELQIGHLINAKVDNEFEIAEVQGLSSYSIDLKTESGCMGDFEEDEVEPIEITREILEESGFETFKDEENNYVFVLDGFAIFQTSVNLFYLINSKISLEENGFLEEKCKINIEFIHQLQNLYYWTTFNKLILSIDIGFLEFAYSKSLIESKENKNVSYPPKRKKKKK